MYVCAMYSQSIPVNAPALVMPSRVKADLGRVENETESHDTNPGFLVHHGLFGRSF